MLTVQARQLLQAEKQTAEAPKGDPRDRFTGYEPVDSEGNPWWDPPNRDIFEGGAWEASPNTLAQYHICRKPASTAGNSMLLYAVPTNHQPLI
jgi:hypothetical protein